jgi:hypothetical protein
METSIAEHIDLNALYEWARRIQDNSNRINGFSKFTPPCAVSHEEQLRLINCLRDLFNVPPPSSKLLRKIPAIRKLFDREDFKQIAPHFAGLQKIKSVINSGRASGLILVICACVGVKVQETKQGRGKTLARSAFSADALSEWKKELRLIYQNLNYQCPFTQSCLNANADTVLGTFADFFKLKQDAIYSELRESERKFFLNLLFTICGNTQTVLSH